VRSLVRSLSVEYASCGRTHAGTWGPCGSRDRQPMGREVQSPTGRGLSSPEAAGMEQLADGRDLHQGQGPEERDEQAAKRFLTKAIRRHGVPEKITIDGSAAIRSYHAEHGTAIAIRKIKYLNNIVEQDHRGVKRITRPMLGFTAFDAAQSTLTGIELMHMLRKGQLAGDREQDRSAAEQFYALAA
jgi:DDE superfamily endonuclease